jgi:hypothetical protein
MKSVMTPLEVELTRLDFRVQDAREEGFAEGEVIGEARGISIGESRGEARGEDRMRSLISTLASLARTDDIIRIGSDKEYCTKLMKEFGI